MPTVADVTADLDAFAPPALAADWDNVGLLLGDPAAAVSRILTCLTLTPEVAAEAVETGCQLVVTHHPILFRGAKRLATQLGNVRFLTMVGDGHTAYQNGSPTCIDTAIVAYIQTLALPDKGTVCTQDVPFVQPPPEPAATTSAMPAATHSTFTALGQYIRLHAFR